MGSKILLITDRNGLPLSLAVSGANMHDSQRLEALVRGIRHRIARKGRESSQRLGERKAERFVAFAAVAAALIGYRRLSR